MKEINVRKKVGQKEKQKIFREILSKPGGLLKVKEAMLKPILLDMEWSVRAKISTEVEKLLLDVRSLKRLKLKDFEKIKRKIVKEITRRLESWEER